MNLFTRLMLPLAVLFFAATFAIVGASAVAVAESGYRAPAPMATPCNEDEPCWSWSTMGDRHRGVVTLHGNERVIGPCTFQRWMRSGRIAYSVTVDGVRYATLERMTGDAWALRHGCES